MKTIVESTLPTLHDIIQNHPDAMEDVIRAEPAAQPAAQAEKQNDRPSAQSATSRAAKAKSPRLPYPLDLDGNPVLRSAVQDALLEHYKNQSIKE